MFRLLALTGLLLGIGAVIRWDLKGNQLISGSSLIASMLIGIIGVVWGMTSYDMYWRPYMTNVGYFCFGIGVWRFFWDRRL
jgi:hypothetical protein